MNIATLSRRGFLGMSAMAAVSYAAPMSKGRVRVGLQTNGFPLKVPNFDGLLKVLAEAKGMGYAGFECNQRFVRAQFGDETAKKRIQDTGMDFIGIHCSTNDGDKGDLPKLASGAASLGARNAVMSSSGLAKDGKFTPEAAKAKCEKLNGFGAECKKHGVTLAYHNHTTEFANSNAEIMALAAGTDPKLVSFLMDAGHGYQGGGNPADFMRKHSRRIVGCHLKTFEHNVTQVPLGKGDFGFEDLAKAIRETNWSGWLMDEEGGGAKGGDTAAVAPDREYIRKVFGV